MYKRITIAGLLVFALLTALTLVPSLVEKRSIIVSTPIAPGVNSRTLVKLRPRDLVCVDKLIFSPKAEVVEVKLGRWPSPPLQLSATAPGYRATSSVPANHFAADDMIPFSLRPPKSELGGGSVCIRNVGHRSLTLVGPGKWPKPGSTRTPTTLLNGRPSPDISIRFREAKPASLASRAGTILDRISTFRPGIVGPIVLWPLTILILLGVPIAAALAVAGAAKSDMTTRPLE